MVRVWTARAQGFMTVQGVLAIPPRFESANEFSEGLARVRQEGKYGFIDKKGGIALEARFDFAAPFRDGLAYVNLGREAAYITPQGAEVWRGPRS